jgi:hypothetical protein
MRFSLTTLALLVALSVTVGCSPKQAVFHITQTSPPSGATHGFVIHLQGGFDQSRETMITVDGREVYRGNPITNPLLGLAGTVSVFATSDQPVVTLKVPTGGVDWSKTIDLKGGAALGISVSTNGQIQYSQRGGFGYD